MPNQVATQLIDQGRTWLIGHYPDYFSKPERERRVLAAGWLCDVIKPREKTGRNDGPVVEAILSSSGAGKGDPWCAADQTFLAIVAKAWYPDESPAAVISWKRLGRRLSDKKLAQRGDLLIRDMGEGKRHIGICLSVFSILGIRWAKTIEGNTSPTDAGSQRDGQGMYRKTRLLSFWTDAVQGAM